MYLPVSFYIYIYVYIKQQENGVFRGLCATGASTNRDNGINKEYIIAHQIITRTQVLTLRALGKGFDGEART